VNPSLQIINLVLYVTLFLLLPTGAMAYLLYALGPPKKRIINVDPDHESNQLEKQILHFHWPNKRLISHVFSGALASLLLVGFPE